MPATPSFAGPGESLHPRRSPERTPTPPWLQRLVTGAATADAEWSSRFVPPDDGARESAVLLLFGPDADGAESLLLIERSHGMRSHPGQIALPGGATDPGDADAAATALREAEEEVRLDRAGAEVVGILPPLFLPPSGFVVTTVVAWWADPGPVAVGDPREVAQVILAPLDYLTDPAARHTVTHPSGYRGPAFVLGDDLLLWGFTGGVVNEALQLAGLERPWDESRLLPLPERFTRGRS
ncbi:MAG: CoA pyrophosphatase [Actinomycetota bacterium]|nr:CoA pyrophosphatase [Actinomycetota bacterium]